MFDEKEGWFRWIWIPSEKIWKSSIPMKSQIVYWLAIFEKLNTMYKLWSMMPHVYWCPQRCIMCKEKRENVNHNFLHWTVANFLLVELQMKAGVDPFLIPVDLSSFWIGIVLVGSVKVEFCGRRYFGWFGRRWIEEFSLISLEIVGIFGIGLFLWPFYGFQYLKNFWVLLY